MSTPETKAADESALSLLVELVRLRSVTPDDAGCQDLIASRLRSIGFECESLQFGDVTNLWARRGTASPVFCFAGHTDVVPPGDENEWQSDPFEPVIRGDYLYGRGTADMNCSPSGTASPSSCGGRSASARRSSPSRSSG